MFDQLLNRPGIADLQWFVWNGMVEVGFGQNAFALEHGDREILRCLVGSIL